MPIDPEVEDFLTRPLVDIIDEIKCLRAENASLTASLRCKISAQHRVPGQYISQLAETKSFLRDVVQRYGLQLPSLPPETLLAIFRFTQPPGSPYHYEPSIFHGPRNPRLDSLKTKKALVLVCKAWAAPATELLYSDVVLRRMGQVSALANTFREDRKQGLANLVRAIRVDGCVVLTHCAPVVREDFEYILNQCKMLFSFVYNPEPQFQVLPYDFACGATPTSPTAFNPTWILDPRLGRAGDLLAQSLNSRLLTLHLGLTTYNRSFRPLGRILSSAPYLTSLVLGSMLPRPDDPPIGTPPPLPDLLFPSLKTLSIFCDFPPFVDYVTEKWTMPRLSSLTCKEADHIPTPLLGAHGEQLTYLHFTYITTRYDLLANTTLLPHLHRLCPHISHLATVIVSRERTALNIHSPTLRYLDICARPSVAAYRAIALAPTARAPQLTKVRMVADVHDFVPRYFHPAHLPGSGRALEDVSDIPGARESDERANWLMSTTGGIAAGFPEWHMRQHPWAVAIDEVDPWASVLGSRDVRGPRRPGEGEGEGGGGGGGDAEMDSDSGDEYEYESLPSSPEGSENASGDEGDEDDWEMGVACARGDDDDDDDDNDSDVGRAWFNVGNPVPPVRPAPIAFVDDLLDSSGRRYDRETILECFSQSQLGDFLLE